MAIFVGNELEVQLKFKLDNRCSNNQAEQLAIFKALEAIETTEITAGSNNKSFSKRENRFKLHRDFLIILYVIYFYDNHLFTVTALFLIRFNVFSVTDGTATDTLYCTEFKFKIRINA